MNVAADFIGNRNGDFGQKRRTPGTEERRRDGKAKSITERLIDVGPPHHRNFPDVESNVLKNDVIFFVNPDGAGVEVETRIRRVVGSERAVLDAISVSRYGGDVRSR